MKRATMIGRSTRISVVRIHTPQAPYLFPDGARLGADNVVLQARARSHRVESYSGPLSIKTVLAGQVAWIIRGRELVVDRSSFLIVSEGETYSMNIAEAKPVETCCVFFAPGFVESVALDATSPVERGLDLPDRAAPALPYLCALHGDRERALTGRVQSLAARCRGALAPSGFEEDFLVLAHQLLQFYETIREKAARLPAIRQSTRQELFRRLLVGRDYLIPIRPGRFRSPPSPGRPACRHFISTADSPRRLRARLTPT